MMTLRDWQGFLLLLAFLPMVITGVFVVLAFGSMGYGKIGKALISGFSTLGLSLLLSFVNMQFLELAWLVIPIGILRIVGWTGLAYGLIQLYREANRGLM